MWTAVVVGPDARRTPAEMVASLYDAIAGPISPSRTGRTSSRCSGQSRAGLATSFRRCPWLQTIHRWESPLNLDTDWRYRSFPREVIAYGADEEFRIVVAIMVSTEMEGGYMASATLAGTRMRTELRDANSAVSVDNSQSLTEVGATNNPSAATARSDEACAQDLNEPRSSPATHRGR